MGTKINPGKYDCYAKAGDNEPIFTLRANDPIAPLVVRNWATIYRANLGHEDDKYYEAIFCAEQMERWLKPGDVKVSQEAQTMREKTPDEYRAEGFTVPKQWEPPTKPLPTITSAYCTNCGIKVSWYTGNRPITCPKCKLRIDEDRAEKV